MKNSLKTPVRRSASAVLVAGIALTAVVTRATLAPVKSAYAHRNDNAFGPSALSILPLASVASVAVVGSGASAAVVAIPLALSVGGATLVVKSVEVSARGTVCVLERVSDGASATLEFSGRSAERASLVVGRSVEVSVVGAGVVLSTLGGVIAFIPNELGRALLHNERLTN